MKKLLWIIGGVLVVAVAGVLVGPGLIDWNKYKQDIQAQAKAAIGRELLRSEEHTSELQSRRNLVCRLLLEKKKPNLS